MEEAQSAPPPTSSMRRQALNACDACRQRKTKCDEAKPACKRCARLSIHCRYDDTIGSNKTVLAVELRDTLRSMSEKLDSLAREQAEQRRLLSRAIYDTRTRAHAAASPSFSLLSAPFGSPLDAPVSVSSTHYPALDTERIHDELSLTQRHSTAPQHLLLWPCSPLKLEQQELQYPMDVEIKQPKLPSMTSPPRFLQCSPTNPASWIAMLSLGQLTALTEAYFSHFHPICLVLDEAYFHSTYLSNAVKSGFSQSIDSCVVLLVCALGAVAAHYDGKGEWAGEDPAEVGLGFLNLALDIFRHAGGADWDSVQCLLLMGLFYSSNLKVYDAWQSIHKACSIMLILVPLQTQLEPHQCELFWIGYLHESQILAEFDFPASGLGKLEGAIPLPLKPGASRDPQHAQYSFFFLSLITMRLLLNRTIYHLYSRERNQDNLASDAAPAALKLVSASRSLIRELNRQLEEWRSCLPTDFKFESFENTPENAFIFGDTQPWSTMDRLRGSLMARYFSAKSIIHRPYLYRMLHREGHHLSTDAADDERGAFIALGAARLSTVCSGVLHQPLPLLLHPINSWRSLFVLEIQLIFASKLGRLVPALPKDWDQIRLREQQIVSSPTYKSGTVTRDHGIIQDIHDSIYGRASI